MLIAASPQSTTAAADSAAVRVILVGDSTMAKRNGYGDALCDLFRPEVVCINMAVNGRSSQSFRAEGRWDQVMALLRDSGQYRNTYVLIQFGHNDQPGKPGRSTDLASEFPANMARYLDDVKHQGAIPVLVTPLTRRIFRNGELQNDLKPWADATRRVAEKRNAPLLDLNARSAAAVMAMGSVAADTLATEMPPDKSATPRANLVDNVKAESNNSAKSKFDYTHLGAKGAAFFSRMVMQELVLAIPDIAPHIKRDNAAQ